MKSNANMLFSSLYAFCFLFFFSSLYFEEHSYNQIPLTSQEVEGVGVLFKKETFPNHSGP